MVTYANSYSTNLDKLKVVKENKGGVIVVVNKLCGFILQKSSEQ